MRTHQKFSCGAPFSLEDRFALVGMTRTGKTTTARQIIKKYALSYPGLRIHIFDPKDVGDYNSIVRGVVPVPTYHVRSKGAPDLLHNPGILVWHPKGSDFDDMEQFFKALADDPEPSLTVIDETRRLSKRMGDGTSYPLSVATLMQEGAGNLHAVLVLLQEIAGTARQFMGQSTHLLRFRLENAYDERATERRFARARKAGRITTEEPSHWHGFYHSRVDMLDQAREYHSWQQFI